MATDTVPAAVPGPSEPNRPATANDQPATGFLAAMLAPVEPARPTRATFNIDPETTHNDTSGDPDGILDRSTPGVSSDNFRDATDKASKNNDPSGSGSKASVWKEWWLAAAKRWAKGGGTANKRLDLAKARAQANQVKETRATTVNRSGGLPVRNTGGSGAGSKDTRKSSGTGSDKTAKGPKGPTNGTGNRSNGPARKGPSGASGGGAGGRGPGGGSGHGSGGRGPAERSSKTNGPSGTDRSTRKDSAGTGKDTGRKPNAGGGSGTSGTAGKHGKDGAAGKGGGTATDAKGATGRGATGKTDLTKTPKAGDGNANGTKTAGGKTTGGKGGDGKTPAGKPGTHKAADTRTPLEKSRETGHGDGSTARRVVDHVKAYTDGARDGWDDEKTKNGKEHDRLDKAHDKHQPKPTAPGLVAAPTEEDDGVSTDVKPLMVKAIDANTLTLDSLNARPQYSRRELRNFKQYERKLEEKETVLHKISDAVTQLEREAEDEARDCQQLAEQARSVEGGDKTVGQLNRLAEAAKNQAAEAGELAKRAKRAAEMCKVVLTNIQTRYAPLYKAVVDSDETKPAELRFYNDKGSYAPAA